MKPKITNIVCCGVGGQGVLLFTDILAQVAMSAGLDVKKSEVHGMAQRGGSVISQLRFGEKIYSPLIEETTADFIVGFEKLETLRYLHFLSQKGKVLLDSLEIAPMPVLTGALTYPSDIMERIQAQTNNVYVVDAFKLALELGEARAQNVIMLGALSRFLRFPYENYEQAIKENIKPKFVDLNLKAFKLGKKLIKK
ncbi:MAG: indolepyruvate oxidoreductase subunit beta [Candidatus Latescibacteria bacterium]|nr:indolepyruvate oxidoreductase subunit beta [Candidatus Latescibacterota bacterium]